MSPSPRRHTRAAIVIAPLLASVVACARSPYPPPPPTRRAAVVDTIHGVAFSDPYRWLEDQHGDATRAWVAAQNAYADSILGPDSTRRDLTTRLAQLMSGPSIGAPRRAGAWEYFTLRRTGEDVAAIYRRPAPKQPAPIDPKIPYQKIVDPLAIRADGTTSVAIEDLSPDGRFLLYSVRDGGPDEVTVHARNLATGRDLRDSLPWALYGDVEFAPSGKGFYYVRRSRQAGPRLEYHRLGTPVTRDSVLFGAGYGPTAFLGVSFPENGRWRLYSVDWGWARSDVLLQDVAHGGRIITIAKGLDAHFAPRWVDGRIWMRTDLGAPKGRLVIVDPATPSPKSWRTLIPEGKDVLDGYTRIGDRLYVTYLHDVGDRIRVFSLAGKPVREVPVPDHASATIRGTARGAALLTITSLTQPAVTYRVDLATGRRTVWQPAETTFDTTGIAVRQVWYTSKDGTRAPMYLMYRRGVAHDGQAPTLLYGYGGFDVGLMPRFDARAAVWVEHGGIYAQATLRGGDEFGERWHRDGMLANKQHVFDDFEAAAQWLVDSGYTSPRRLAIRGVSNGGLLMGAAVTQRPGLFRAAFIGRPDLDMVRFYRFTSANNAPALLEYGDARDSVQFQAIRAFSPYQNVRDGTRYPAIMFDVGLWDTRVPPWQARKMAARLQAATRSGLPVILRQDPRSGHAGGRSWTQSVEAAARELEFLLRLTGPASP